MEIEILVNTDCDASEVMQQRLLEACRIVGVPIYTVVVSASLLPTHRLFSHRAPALFVDGNELVPETAAGHVPGSPVLIKDVPTVAWIVAKLLKLKIGRENGG